MATCVTTPLIERLGLAVIASEKDAVMVTDWEVFNWLSVSVSESVTVGAVTSLMISIVKLSYPLGRAALFESLLIKALWLILIL